MLPGCSHILCVLWHGHHTNCWMLLLHRVSLHPFERKYGSFCWDSILGIALPKKGKILSEWKRELIGLDLLRSHSYLSLICLVFLSLSLSNCHSHCFRDEYFRMKVQWKSVSEEQEMRNSLLRGYRSLIGLFWIPLLLIGLFMLVLQWSVWFFLCFELGRAGRKSDR